MRICSYFLWKCICTWLMGSDLGMLMWHGGWARTNSCLALFLGFKQHLKFTTLHDLFLLFIFAECKFSKCGSLWFVLWHIRTAENSDCSRMPTSSLLDSEWDKATEPLSQPSTVATAAAQSTPRAWCVFYESKPQKWGHSGRGAKGHGDGGWPSLQWLKITVKMSNSTTETYSALTE